MLSQVPSFSQSGIPANAHKSALSWCTACVAMVLPCPRRHKPASPRSSCKRLPGPHRSYCAPVAAKLSIQMACQNAVPALGWVRAGKSTVGALVGEGQVDVPAGVGEMLLQPACPSRGQALPSAAWCSSSGQLSGAHHRLTAFHEWAQHSLPALPDCNHTIQPLQQLKRKLNS